MAAIDIVQSYKKNTERSNEMSIEDVVDMLEDMIDDIKNEPSAQPERPEQPERKIGRWLEDAGPVKCNICGYRQDDETNFCPNCGAYMREEDVDMSYRQDAETISRQAAIDLLKKWSDGYSYIEVETNSAIKAFEEMPSAQPETCEGCKHLGKWENEVEYGYPSPCTRCKRRVGDHYER